MLPPEGAPFPRHTLTLEPQSPGSLLSRVLKNCSSTGNISQALDTFANVAHPKRLHSFSLNLQIMILLFSLHLSTTESLPGESISKQTLSLHNHPASLTANPPFLKFKTPQYLSQCHSQMTSTQAHRTCDVLIRKCSCGVSVCSGCSTRHTKCKT